MKIAGLVLATALAVAVQSSIGRYVGTAAGLDFVLIVVVYSALAFGPVSGLLSGTIAGLVQDAMSTGIIGVGGLAKTVVGFVIGIVGTQFIVAHPLPHFVVFFGASLLHAAVFIGVYAVLGSPMSGDPYRGIGLPALVNAMVGLLVLKIVDSLPGAEERRHASTRIRR